MAQEQGKQTAEDQGRASVSTAEGEPQGQQPEQPKEPEGPEGLDYKALWEAEKKHSQKWEGIAKANKKDLAGMADPEELAAANRALEEARAEAAALKAQAEHAEAVVQVAAETGLPEAAIRAMRGETAEELRASAEALEAATSAYPLTRDQGEQHPAPLTKEAILAIKDRDKRLDAIQRNANLWN